MGAPGPDPTDIGVSLGGSIGAQGIGSWGPCGWQSRGLGARGPGGSSRCCCQYCGGHLCSQRVLDTPGTRKQVGGWAPSHLPPAWAGWGQHARAARVPEEHSHSARLSRLPRPAPGACMWPSSHPWGAGPHPCLVSPQGSVGQRYPGSCRQPRGQWVVPGCRSPLATWEGIELGASSSCPSSARSLSNCRAAPPGGPMCQVIHAHAHVSTHEHAHTGAGTYSSL